MCSPDFDNERKARLLSCWYVLHLFTHTHIHSDATSRCFPQNKCASFAVIPCLYQATGTATREDDEDKPLRVETTTDSGCLTHVSALPQPKKGNQITAFVTAELGEHIRQSCHRADTRAQLRFTTVSTDFTWVQIEEVIRIKHRLNKWGEVIQTKDV